VHQQNVSSSLGRAPGAIHPKRRLELSCYDNAVTESFFHTLKTESVDFEHFESRAEAHHHLFDYIEVFYNQKRMHSSLGYHTPCEKLQGIDNSKVA
jgi:transposase InsO family protein